MPESKRPEDMAAFFDTRARGYEKHMRATVEDFDAFYGAVASAIPPNAAPIRVLDLGVGTGLELDAIFARAPRATITCIDVSSEMLGRLIEKYSSPQYRLTPVHASYMNHPLGNGIYDYAVTTMSLHHLLPAARGALYRRVRAALRGGGTLVEGDYVVSAMEERRALSHLVASNLPLDGSHHIDIPLSLHTLETLIEDAGFREFRVLHQTPRSAVYQVCAP